MSSSNNTAPPLADIDEMYEPDEIEQRKIDKIKRKLDALFTDTTLPPLPPRSILTDDHLFGSLANLSNSDSSSCHQRCSMAFSVTSDDNESMGGSSDGYSSFLSTYNSNSNHTKVYEAKCPNDKDVSKSSLQTNNDEAEIGDDEEVLNSFISDDDYRHEDREVTQLVHSFDEQVKVCLSNLKSNVEQLAPVQKQSQEEALQTRP